MSEEGTPVFLEERRDIQELCEVTAVLKQAEDIACEFFTLFYQKGQYVSSRLIEEIYEWSSAVEQDCISVTA